MVLWSGKATHANKMYVLGNNMDLKLNVIMERNNPVNCTNIYQSWFQASQKRKQKLKKEEGKKGVPSIL